MNKTLTYSQRLPRAWHAIALSLMLTLQAHPSYAEQNLAMQQIIDATQSFLEQIVVEHLQRSAIQGRHEVQVNRLDPRLRLVPCDAPLLVTLASPAQPIGRLSVRLQCEGAHPWTVFMPAYVRVYRKIAVTTRAINRHSILSEDDVALLERDIGSLSQDYLTDLEQVVGQTPNRNLTSGQSITASILQQPNLIHKGDQVTISAIGAGINVRMIGEALSDGVIGQQIRVKNLKSNRIIRARVVASGQVEVNM